MHSDAFFAMGKTHTVCQDYARAGKTSTGRTYAIVSDGCSSSPDTDFGSRFLVTAAVQALEQQEQPDPLRIIWRAKEPALGFVPLRCLDATLLMAYELDNGQIAVDATGDGVIVALGKDGSIEVWEIDQAGFPGYLSYGLDLTRLRGYLTESGGKRLVRHWYNGVPLEDQESCITISRDKTPRIDGMTFRLEFDPEETQLVMVLSDGVLSFGNYETGNPVPLEEVLPQVLNIKVPKGEFLLRAHRWFLTKECPKRSWQHSDDFGAAAIILGD
jgi:hypothetical protein